MNKKSHISIDNVMFCAYTSAERKEVGKNLWKLAFDTRHDFPIDSTFAGIAAQIHFVNERAILRPQRGVRHKMLMTLTDTTAQVEVATHNVCTHISKNDFIDLGYMDFPLESTQFLADHSYKFAVHDLTASTTLGEYLLHLSAFKQQMPKTECPSSCFDADDFEKELDRFIVGELESPQDKEEEMLQDKDKDKKDGDNKPVLSYIEHLTGLKSVKEKLSTYERVVCFNKMRTYCGLPVPSVPLHAMFLGSLGTGKTTVAQIMGSMLQRAGILSKGHVVVRERATLLGQNYNSESEKTLGAIEEAQGGILFIDEAYQLYQPNDARDPGKFVIETLLTSLADESKRDWMLILAGYPEDMMRMFDMNPGLKSRIPESNIYMFEDFSENELMEIAENYLLRNQYTLLPDAHTALADRLRHDYLCREKNFGNCLILM